MQCLYNIQYLKKEVRDAVDVSQADKHQSFQQADLSTLGNKVSYKVMILSLLMGMIKDSQSIESSKFAISLQYLKIEVRDGAHFLHADKHQSFHTSWYCCFCWK